MNLFHISYILFQGAKYNFFLEYANFSEKKTPKTNIFLQNACVIHFFIVPLQAKIKNTISYALRGSN